MTWTPMASGSGPVSPNDRRSPFAMRDTREHLEINIEV
ncbi:hypothetical protein PSNTI_02030 [Stutzerimonas stutzeri]|nr:hypothetical protein PSNTI_02030 [Stutzerimonas stutzeri]